MSNDEYGLGNVVSEGDCPKWNLRLVVLVQYRGRVHRVLLENGATDRVMEECLWPDGKLKLDADELKDFAIMPADGIGGYDS